MIATKVMMTSYDLQRLDILDPPSWISRFYKKSRMPPQLTKMVVKGNKTGIKFQKAAHQNLLATVKSRFVLSVPPNCFQINLSKHLSNFVTFPGRIHPSPRLNNFNYIIIQIILGKTFHTILGDKYPFFHRK